MCWVPLDVVIGGLIHFEMPEFLRGKVLRIYEMTE